MYYTMEVFWKKYKKRLLHQIVNGSPAAFRRAKYVLWQFHNEHIRCDRQITVYHQEWCRRVTLQCPTGTASVAARNAITINVKCVINMCKKLKPALKVFNEDTVKPQNVNYI